MRTAHCTIAGCLAMVALLLASAPAHTAAEALPPAVADAIQKAFPTAAVSDLDRETENGVAYYEVNLTLNGHRTEVEVDPYGGIGEIERRVEIKALPRPLAEAIAHATEGGGEARVERHERWGVARGDRFVKLDAPRVFYEITLYRDEGKLTAKWTPSDYITLPEQVASALKAAFPGAVAVDVEQEDEDGFRLYEVSLLQAGREMEVEISPDGVIVEIETETSIAALPQAVLAAIQAAAGEGRVTSVERTEIRAVVQDGALALLAQPRVVYEAELVRGDEGAEIEVAADGTVLEKPEWKQMRDRDDDDDDNDDGEDDD